MRTSLACSAAENYSIITPIELRSVILSISALENRPRDAFTLFGLVGRGKMFFKPFGKKTVKELRKNQGLTARELAIEINTSEALVRKTDYLQFNNVPEPLKSRMEPVLRGKG